jgi:hypothetical protein
MSDLVFWRVTPIKERSMFSLTTPAPAPSPEAPAAARAFVPIAVDVLVPLALYYLLHAGLGVGLITSLTASSIVPLGRTIWAHVRQGEVNALALLILAVNVAGILLTFVSGNARVMFVKNSGVSSVIALGILFSVVRGRPLMTAGLKPFITKGDELRTAAWDRLAGSSAQFRRYEGRFSLIWGLSLLTECVLRIIAAFTFSPSTMVWLSDVLLFGGIAVAVVISGGAASSKMEKLVDHESAAE